MRVHGSRDVREGNSKGVCRCGYFCVRVRVRVSAILSMSSKHYPRYVQLTHLCDALSTAGGDRTHIARNSLGWPTKRRCPMAGV